MLQLKRATVNYQELVTMRLKHKKETDIRLCYFEQHAKIHTY